MTPAPATAGATDTATVGAAQAYDRSYTYDQAGRLTTVTDRTATVAMGSLTPDTAASGLAPCQVRTYGLNADGARTSSGVENHSDGDCTGTTSGTVTTATTAYHVDTADRFTTAATTDGSAGAGYAYDGLGRQTTIPAADTPAGAGAGDLSLGYYVDDLPQSVSQHGVTATFTLDAAGRRATQTVTGGTDDGTTITRHYTDGSDNPGWETTTGAAGVGLGGGFSAGWNRSSGASLRRMWQSSRGYTFGYGACAAVCGSYSWSTNRRHTRQVGRAHSWETGMGLSFQVGPGYSRSFRMLPWL